MSMARETLPRLSGWGRYPVIRAPLFHPETEYMAAELVKEGRSLIARGNARSYGDCAAAPGGALSLLKFNRLIAFDTETGILTAQAGVLLNDVLSAFVPRGFFVPVVPGTRFVTLGGMIAADVHGKNHMKAGSFGAHVVWLDLLCADGKVRRCSPAEHGELFAATIGGMGLTGLILHCAIRLNRVETAYVRQRRVVTADLNALIDAFEDSHEASYRVAWLDCLSRGEGLGRALLDLSEHAEPDDLPQSIRMCPFRTPARRTLSMPIDLPVSAVNGLTVRTFNELYFAIGARKAQTSLLPYHSAFFPLDEILNWNRIYGRGGFAQYQCVLPLAGARSGLHALLRAISRAGMGSFLSVLKRFGEGRGGLSFPREGYTLAIDFAWSDRASRLLDELDAITIEHGGHVYLAKDARAPRAAFERMQKGLGDFRALRAETGSAERFQSFQSKRLGL